MTETSKEIREAIKDLRTTPVKLATLIPLLQKAADELDDSLTRQLHTQQWYGVRFERLWHWAHAELNETQKNRYFNIVANGTADVNESPTIGQQMNMLRHELEAAQAEIARLKSV